MDRTNYASPRALLVGAVVVIVFIFAVTAANTIGLIVGLWLTRMFTP